MRTKKNVPTKHKTEIKRKNRQNVANELPKGDAKGEDECVEGGEDDEVAGEADGAEENTCGCERKKERKRREREEGKGRMRMEREGETRKGMWREE